MILYDNEELIIPAGINPNVTTADVKNHEMTINENGEYTIYLGNYVLHLTVSVD